MGFQIEIKETRFNRLWRELFRLTSKDQSNDSSSQENAEDGYGHSLWRDLWPSIWHRLLLGTCWTAEDTDRVLKCMVITWVTVHFSQACVWFPGLATCLRKLCSISKTKPLQCDFKGLMKEGSIGCWWMDVRNGINVMRKLSVYWRLGRRRLNVRVGGSSFEASTWKVYWEYWERRKRMGWPGISRPDRWLEVWLRAFKLTS